MRELGVLTTQVTWPSRPMPDRELYLPYVRGWATFAPWSRDPYIRSMGQRMHEHGVKTLVDADRAWTLICAFRQTSALPGEVWETGVYQVAQRRCSSCSCRTRRHRPASLLRSCVCSTASKGCRRPPAGLITIAAAISPIPAWKRYVRRSGPKSGLTSEPAGFRLHLPDLRSRPSGSRT
jgi:hypothetical protein